MSAKRRFAALLAAIFIVSLMPRTAADGGQNATRPMRRAMKQVEKDELAIFKPIIEADFKVIEKALSKPPKSKERGVKAWGLIYASDTAIYGALGLSGGKKTVSDDYGALFKKEKEDYTKDHNMWMGGVLDSMNNFFLNDSLDSRYKDMDKAGMVSFSPPASFDVSFDVVNPGFDNNINYLTAYQDMMTKIQNYAKGLLKDNDAQTSDFASVLTLPIKSPFAVITALDAASQSAKQYREALQIRNRVALFAAQEVSNLRLNIATQIDADAKFALSRQQIRTDRQAAFKRSVGTWNSGTGSTAAY